MNLKSQISKFRSQMLIGRYESAIVMGKNILSQIEILIMLKILKDDTLQTIIQEEYEKCLSFNSLIKKNISLHEDQNIKKWGNKSKQTQQQQSKWKRKALNTNSFKVPNQPESNHESQNKILELSSKQSQFLEQFKLFQDKIQKEIMMPIKMPSFFKNLPPLFKIIKIPKQIYNIIISYFKDNGFISFEFHKFIKSIEDKNHCLDIGDCKQVMISCVNNDIDQIMQLKDSLGLSGFNYVFILITKGKIFEII